MPLLSCECVAGKPPLERLTDIYASFQEISGDATLPSEICVNGKPPWSRLDDIYCAVRSWTGDSDLPTCLCVESLSLSDKLSAIYEAIFSAASDASLTDPLCIRGLPIGQQLDAIYSGLFSMVGDSSQVDPLCVAGFPDYDKLTAIYCISLGVSLYDPDAQAYFEAAGITNTTQKDAYNAHVLRGKAEGWYSKLAHEYPFIGGTFSSHRIDSINPTGVALTKVNTVTDSANGVQGDGVSGYLISGHNRNDLPQTLMSMAVYIRTSPSADFMEYGSVDDFGAGNTQFTSIYNTLATINGRNNSTGTVASNMFNLGGVIFTREVAQGRLLITGDVAFTDNVSAAPTANLALSWPILALNRNGVISGFNDGQVSYYARLNDTLSLVEAIGYRDSINQMQTDLGRATH